MDINCAKCHEPWDAYGVRNGDMTTEESRRFLRGEGCPGCNFGQSCPSCSGTGKERNYSPYHECQACRGQNYLVARLLDANGQPFSSHPGFAPPGIGQPIQTRYVIEYDFVPNVKRLTPEQRQRATFRKTFEHVQCRDGWYVSVMLNCPTEHASSPCAECNGDGKLHRGADNTALFQVASDLLAGDADGLQAILEDLSV